MEKVENPEPREKGLVDEEEKEHETIYGEATDEDKGVLAEINFGLKETGRWLLKVIGGPNNGAEFSMQAGNSYTIGTDPASCDVVFHDTSVSRQHARITVGSNDTITIEDLKSRNGVLIDGEPVAGKRPLEPNTLVTMGTTSLIVFDREGDMQTIISPLLPSIVKVLQREDEKKEEQIKKDEAQAAAKIEAETLAAQPRKTARYILIGVLAAMFALVGFGTISLFRSEPIQVREEINFQAELDKALSPFPSVIPQFTHTTGRLLLVGHVLTLSDKNQLLYNLRSLPFIKSIDDNDVIIDELVWRETNAVLNRDVRWKGISIHSPKAGKFILSGYLQTRKQAEELNDYITSNFVYLDLLERKIIVEEDVINSIEIALENSGIRNLLITMNNGEITIRGGLSKDQIIALDRLSRKFKEIPGVRNVKTFVNELEAEQVSTNITDRYKVTGSSHQGGSNFSVIINGRILTRGDTLDGMTITIIRPNVIFLEKEGIKYRIDYNQQ